MITLVYEDVALKKGSLDSPVITAIEALKKFLKENENILVDDVTFRLSLGIKPVTVMRTSSFSNKEALNRLLSLSEALMVWTSKDKKLVLNFEEKIFEYKAKKIYLTAQEQLFLYQRLALGQEQQEGYASVKAQLRHKFGAEFAEAYL